MRNVLKKMLLAALPALALGLVPAGAASAEDVAQGSLVRESDTEVLAEFWFDPDGEHVHVSDEKADHWGVLVELWWDGEIQRWCWQTKGDKAFTKDCNLDIPDGQQITFFITEAHKDQWDECLPGDGCGKRRHFWVGKGDSGCDKVNDGVPCAYSFRDDDFEGQA